MDPCHTGRMYGILLGLMVLAAAGLCLWGVKRFVPKYALLPIALTAAVNGIAYYLPKLLPTGLTPVYMGLELDEKIPFCPVFIWVYVLSYLQWLVNWVMLSRQERGFMNRRLAGEWMSKLLCGVCFIFLPTTLKRPVPQTDTFSGCLTALIYRLDTPVNLFPSIHCLESWLCLRNALSVKKAPRWYKPSMVAFALLVLASTLLVKQHVLLDIPAGILAAEVGIMLGDRLKQTPFLDKIEAPFLQTA